MEIGEKIEKLMEEKKLWPSKLAHILTTQTGRGYNFKNIHKIITGEKRLSERELQILSEIFHVRKEYLLDNKRDYPPHEEDRTKTAYIDLMTDIRAVTLDQKTQWLEEEMKQYEPPPMIGKIYIKEIDLKGDNVSLTSHNFINYPPIQVSVNDIHFMHPVAWFKRP